MTSPVINTFNDTMIEPQADSSKADYSPPMPYQSLNQIAPQQLPNSLPQQPPTTGQATQQQDTLAQLRDIHLPHNNISDYPIAAGWWIVLLLTISVFTASILCWRKHRRDNRYRQQALAALSVININNSNSQTFMQELNTLLKQCAKEAYPNHHYLSLHGVHWIEFLQASAPSIKIEPELTDFLINNSYQPISKPEMHQAAHDFAAQWFKQHIKFSKLVQATS